MALNAGITIGLVLGVGWADFLPLRLLVIPLAAFSLGSALLSLIWIKEPAFIPERELIIAVRHGFYKRLLALPIIFSKIPRMFDFRKLFNGLSYELTRETQILYLSIFVFYTASGIFNTSLIPSLYFANLSKSRIFLVSLVAMIVQTISFRYVSPYIERRSLKQAAINGLVIRSVCYATIGVAASFVSGFMYLSANLILIPLGAGWAYAVYYAASNVMIFNTLGHYNQGSTLGVYSALVGLATTLGSFISGFISFYVGYCATFVTAAVCLAAATALTSSLGAGEILGG
jgi:hypothetical protein